MDFDLTDEQQMFRDSAERYVRETYTFELRNDYRINTSGCSDEQWQAFAELGWLGLGIPEEMGGLGFGIAETALLTEELGRGLVLEPYLSNVVLCAELLRHSSAGEQLLGSMAEGSLRLSFAQGEVQSRYDLDGDLETSATPVAEGYRLEGSKMLVFDAPSAHQLLVTASYPEAQAPGLFLVPVDSAGVSFSATYPLLDDTRAADIQFDGVELPSAALILSGEQLRRAAASAFDATVLAQCAAALGAMEKVIEITSEYVKTRTQFGQPIGKFQALQHRLAEMFVEVQESRSALYRGLAYARAEEGERARAVSVAKVCIARSAKLVGSLGVQLHGGYGMTDEYQVGHYFRYLTAFEKKYGDLDFHLQRMCDSQPQ